MPIEADGKKAVSECQKVRNAILYRLCSVACVVSIGKTSQGKEDAGGEFVVYGDI